MTIISVSEAEAITAQWLQSCVETWSKLDDVFTSEFLSGILFEVNETRELSLPADVLALFEKWGT